MIRPNVLKMHPYSPGKPIEEAQRELGLERVIKLASNENPLGPSPKAVRAAADAAAQMHLYPDASGYALRQALAKRHALPYEQIVLGNGSDELIHLLGLALLGPDDELMVGNPSFVRYDAAAQIAPCRLVKIPLDTRFRHDLPAMAKAVTERTKLVFVANPNNPTGTVVTRTEWRAFLRDLPKTTLAVLDEAYFEFAAHLEDFPDSMEDVREGLRVVGMRTFSKTYGLAGIRMGYAACPPVIADALFRIREPFSVNSLAQSAAMAALDDEAHLARTIENNRLGLETIAGAFRAVGVEPCESYGNFVFADLGRPAAPVLDGLLRKGVIVRGLGHPQWLRVSVGTPEENELFAKALQAVWPG
jgi:histidinol-phosphate aminotransferase